MSSSGIARTVFSAASRQPPRLVPALPAVRHYSTPVEHSSLDLRRAKDQEEFADALKKSQYFPNLMKHDALLDTHHTQTFPPNKHTPFTHTVTVRNNDPSSFRIANELDNGEKSSGDMFITDEVESSADAMKPIKFLHLGLKEHSKLYRAMYVRRVKQQTGKGKIARFSVLVVVGNGNGLLGLGQGKAGDYTSALDKAFPEAVRNMERGWYRDVIGRGIRYTYVLALFRPFLRGKLQRPRRRLANHRRLSEGKRSVALGRSLPVVGHGRSGRAPSV